MKRHPAAEETARLLSELDTAIDQSSLLREIVDRRKELRALERITGPCRRTRVLQKEIRLLEDRLDTAREAPGLPK